MSDELDDDVLEEIFNEGEEKDELDGFCLQCFEPVQPGEKFCDPDCKKEYENDQDGDDPDWDDIDEDFDDEDDDDEEESK